MSSPFRAARVVSLIGTVCYLSLANLTPVRGAEEDAATQLLPFFSESANVLAVVRVDKLLESPRGKSEGWAKLQRDRFLAGATTVPPGVQAIVLGMQVRPQTHEMVSSVALALVPAGVSLKQLSEAEGGTPLETLVGRPALHSRHNAYYVELTNIVLGIFSPAARQETGRYVRRIFAAETRPPAGYLGTVARLNDHVILAMDLRDMADPVRLQDAVDNLPGVKNNATLRKELVDLLASIEGVRFGANVDVSTDAVLAIDFSKQPGPSALALKSLIIRIISDAGMHIEELDDAKLAIEEKSLTLRMKGLSDASLRLVLSTISSPAPVPERGVARPRTRTDLPVRADPNLSLRYFRAVNQCVDDLQRAYRRSKEPGRTAAWHDNFARKIEKLPTRGVDPDLVAYGALMSQRLRALAASLRGVELEVDVVQRTVTWNARLDPGFVGTSFWGGVGYRPTAVQYTSNLQQVRERQAAAILAGERKRQSIWSLIDDERRQMADKVRMRYGEA